MKKKILVATTLLALVGACSAANEEDSSQSNVEREPADGTMITPDVVYGHKSGMALTFDAYRPSNANRAAVIFVVSGGWRSPWEWKEYDEEPDGSLRLLSAEELKQLAPQPLVAEFSFGPLLLKGFTVFAVRHGGSPNFGIPEIVADLRLAVRFIRHHAHEYGVDSERIGVWGGSSGGHLSLLLGTTGDTGQPDALAAFERSPSRVAAVVAYFPVSDLRRQFDSLTPEVRERFPALHLQEEQFEEYSPLHFASGEDPPTLIIHGDQDTQVPILEGESMYDALLAAGVTTRFITIPDAGHGFVDEEAAQAMEEMVSWFEQHLLGE